MRSNYKKDWYHMFCAGLRQDVKKMTLNDSLAWLSRETTAGRFLLLKVGLPVRYNSPTAVHTLCNSTSHLWLSPQFLWSWTCATAAASAHLIGSGRSVSSWGGFGVAGLVKGVLLMKMLCEGVHDLPPAHGEISVEHPFAHLLPLNSSGKFQVRELIS